jgi:hypothetical protein
VFTYTCFPSLYKYLLLAQIDNNNIHSHAHFGYVHHIINSICTCQGAMIVNLGATLRTWNLFAAALWHTLTLRGFRTLPISLCFADMSTLCSTIALRRWVTALPNRGTHHHSLRKTCRFSAGLPPKRTEPTASMAAFDSAVFRR